LGDIDAQISSGEQRRLADMRKSTCLATHILARKLDISDLFHVYNRTLAVLQNWQVLSV